MKSRLNLEKETAEKWWNILYELRENGYKYSESYNFFIFLLLYFKIFKEKNKQIETEGWGRVSEGRRDKAREAGSPWAETENGFRLF